MEALLKDIHPTIQLLIVMAMFSILPFVFSCMTSFLRYIIVFSIVRTAVGTAQMPPAMAIIGLAMILTLYTMSPVFSEMSKAGQEIYNNSGSIILAVKRAGEPLKKFMLTHTRESDVEFFVGLGKKEIPERPLDLSIATVVPAYIMSEVKSGFTIGFLLFLPFVLIDILVANLLLALGIFMLPPTTIAIPFKILIFVSVDGWSLITNGLVDSFLN